MNSIYKFTLCLLIGAQCGLGASAEPTETWPYWPEYRKTPLDEIRPQKWIETDHVIDGWDWSLPPNVKPAPNGLLAVNRTSNLKQALEKHVSPLNLPINQTIELWIKWQDFEPVEGQYQFDLLRDRLLEAEKLRCSLVLRILFSATTFAPPWMANYQIPIRDEKSKGKPKVTNYEISHPEFHKRYIRFVEKLGASEIPKSKALKGAFVGYASPSFGDEGIGPHGVDPDTVPHVVERLDAWARAFKGVEHKVFMGGVSQHGLKLGFGIRRGFVEMYLYHIPDTEIGQTVDKQGYLYVDESAEVLKRRLFHGEENEEYDEKWATEATGFRFIQNTDSFTYRYFISNLRTLQMQCNHLLHSPKNIRIHDRLSNPANMIEMDMDNTEIYKDFVFGNVSSYVPVDQKKSIIRGSEMIPWYGNPIWKNVTFSTITNGITNTVVLNKKTLTRILIGMNSSISCCSTSPGTSRSP